MAYESVRTLGKGNGGLAIFGESLELQQSPPHWSFLAQYSGDERASSPLFVFFSSLFFFILVLAHAALAFVSHYS